MELELKQTQRRFLFLALNLFIRKLLKQNIINGSIYF